MRKGSTSFGACEVRCWRWLFGNKIPISLADARADADRIHLAEGGGLNGRFQVLNGRFKVLNGRFNVLTAVLKFLFLADARADADRCDLAERGGSWRYGREG